MGREDMVVAEGGGIRRVLLNECKFLKQIMTIHKGVEQHTMAV